MRGCECLSVFVKVAVQLEGVWIMGGFNNKMTAERTFALVSMSSM